MVMYTTSESIHGTDMYMGYVNICIYKYITTYSTLKQKSIVNNHCLSFLLKDFGALNGVISQP